MGRILAFDYGRKRTGVAVTDPLQIIASTLTTVETQNIFTYISDYVSREKVDCFVVGFPFLMENTKPSDSLPLINSFIETLKAKFPTIPVEVEDEHFTSKLAVKAMIEGGIKKKQRKNKALIDKVSASIILRNYLERKAMLNQKSNLR